MRKEIPSLSKQLTEEKVFQAINKNYSQLTNTWFNFQMEWLRSSYHSFHDHDKFLIIQYLVHKTLNILHNQNMMKMKENYYYEAIS